MQKAIQETITGAYETMQGMGVFVSPDGTTAEFSDEEIDAMVQDYNSKVDRYYAKEAGQYAEYMAANEDYLRNAFKAPSEIYNVIDSGVLSCDIQSIRMEDDGQTAVVTSDVLKWSNAISSWQSLEGAQEEPVF